VNIFEIREPETYYSGVISHSYYAIFYAAKEYLHKKGVTITAPEEHRKAFDAFSEFVTSGELDVELLRIYRQAVVRAESLLGIFKAEKQKRGEFTYRTIPQANREPARESIANAQTFFRHMYSLCSG